MIKNLNGIVIVIWLVKCYNYSYKIYRFCSILSDALKKKKREKEKKENEEKEKSGSLLPTKSST